LGDFDQAAKTVDLAFGLAVDLIGRRDRGSAVIASYGVAAGERGYYCLVCDVVLDCRRRSRSSTGSEWISSAYDPAHVVISCVHLCVVAVDRGNSSSPAVIGLGVCKGPVDRLTLKIQAIGIRHARGRCEIPVIVTRAGCRDSWKRHAARRQSRAIAYGRSQSSRIGCASGQAGVE